MKNIKICCDIFGIGIFSENIISVASYKNKLKELKIVKYLVKNEKREKCGNIFLVSCFVSMVTTKRIHSLSKDDDDNDA
jgi:hypothetical protein